jgi:hypothetical protein
MRLARKIREVAATGYILFWLLGIPDSSFVADLSFAKLSLSSKPNRSSGQSVSGQTTCGSMVAHLRYKKWL